MSPSLLAVEHLAVQFAGHAATGRMLACADISLTVEAGQVVGLVGASGSGKSMTALAICGLLPPGGSVRSGSIRLEGEDLVGASPSRWRELRGRHVGLVFQDAGRALDPVHTIGHHLRESGGPTCDPALMLERVGLGGALATRYPHQLSGGQRQRAMIAVATARQPSLLLADEPTSSVDAITQVHVLRELVRVQRELGCGLLIISHDIGVISRVADEVVVLNAGHVIEHGTTRQVLTKPASDLTRALLTIAAPPPQRPQRQTGGPTEGLRVDGVTKRYGKSTGRPAVLDVTMQIQMGETLALVGESGSGKSTLGRLAAFVTPPDSGSVAIDGVLPVTLSRRERRQVRFHVQLAHQDVAGALDPRQRVRSIVAEPLRNQRIAKVERRVRVTDTLTAVGLSKDLAERRPAQLSGGQRQRVGLARTLVAKPRYLLLDEPVSALDAALVASTVHLLGSLQHKLGHGCLVISHDLTLVGSLADRLAVMYAGEIVEIGPAVTVLRHPRHPYTRALAAATLFPDVDAGLPDIGRLHPPSERGCAYASRCPSVFDRCHQLVPPLSEGTDTTAVRCWLVGPTTGSP